MEKREREKNPAERIAINITGDKKRFCNICDGLLLSDYSCGKCGVYYQPDEARHQIVIRGMDGKESGPNAPIIPHASVDTTSKPKKRMAPLFEVLEGKGFKWTSYSETNT